MWWHPGDPDRAVWVQRLLTTVEQERLKVLEQENRERKQANGILSVRTKCQGKSVCIPSCVRSTGMIGSGGVPPASGICSRDRRPSGVGDMGSRCANRERLRGNPQSIQRDISWY